MSYIILFFFFTWIVLTILKQFNFNWFKPIIQYDICHVLPIWTFFAPNPSTTDYNLYYRKKTGENEFSDWKNAYESSNRTIISFVWHPEKRKQKLLFDLVQNIIGSISRYESDIETIRLDFSYIGILNYLSTIDTKCEKQFIITQSHGFITDNKPILVLRSEFHLV